MVARRSSIQMVRDRYAPRYERTNPNPRYTRPWQEDRAVAAGGLRKRAAGGGKSELRRAVCRITSGTWALRPMDGQCHRKDTASATPLASRLEGFRKGLSGSPGRPVPRSEEHTSELQSLRHLVCRLLLEKQ